MSDLVMMDGHTCCNGGWLCPLVHKNIDKLITVGMWSAGWENEATRTSGESTSQYGRPQTAAAEEIQYCLVGRPVINA